MPPPPPPGSALDFVSFPHIYWAIAKRKKTTTANQKKSSLPLPFKSTRGATNRAPSYHQHNPIQSHIHHASSPSLYHFLYHLIITSSSSSPFIHGNTSTIRITNNEHKRGIRKTTRREEANKKPYAQPAGKSSESPYSSHNHRRQSTSEIDSPTNGSPHPNRDPRHCFLKLLLPAVSSARPQHQPLLSEAARPSPS